MENKYDRCHQEIESIFDEGVWRTPFYVSQFVKLSTLMNTQILQLLQKKPTEGEFISIKYFYFEKFQRFPEYFNIDH